MKSLSLTFTVVFLRHVNMETWNYWKNSWISLLMIYQNTSDHSKKITFFTEKKRCVRGHFSIANHPSPPVPVIHPQFRNEYPSCTFWFKSCIAFYSSLGAEADTNRKNWSCVRLCGHLSWDNCVQKVIFWSYANYFF